MTNPFYSLTVLLLFLATPIFASPCYVGQEIDVLWQEYWQPSIVIATDGDYCLIRYEGYDEEYDQWVGRDRIRYVDKKAELAVGTEVMVLWQGDWYPATTLKSRGARYYINYDGWGSNFDEWVGPDRLKLR